MPKFASQIDTLQVPVKNLVPERSASAPSSPVTGQLWDDTTNNLLKRWNGSSWVAFAVGSTAPSGPAGGDLTGTYPNPTIGSSKVTSDNIVNGTIVDADIATANKDGAAATPSMRTLGSGAQQALAGNTRPEQLSVALAPLTLNNQRITNLAGPQNINDAANKAYVDAVAQGLSPKNSARLASTANLSLTGIPTIDGIPASVNDRVLAKNQTTASENGLWVVSSPVPWSRAEDFDSASDVTNGAFLFVEEGNTQADTGWVLTTDTTPIIVDVTPLNFTQFSGAGQVVSGAGLTKTGNTLDVIGTTNRISVAADSVDIASNYAGQTSINTLGTIDTGVWQGTEVSLAKGGTGAINASNARINLQTPISKVGFSPALTAGVWTSITHSLVTDYLTANFVVDSTGEQIIIDWRHSGQNAIEIKSDVAFGASALRYHIVGHYL